MVAPAQHPTGGGRPGDLGGSLSRVRVRTFPLAAQRDRLQTFCDRWFNDLVPPEVAVFRPALPIVFCAALYYGEIATDLSWQMGVLTQNELYFLVPLDRYRWADGRLQFVEHCATTPYIFVDNDMSAVIGRERFGFPKQACLFDIRDPEVVVTDGQREISVSAWQPGLGGHVLRALLELIRLPAPWAGISLDRVPGEAFIPPQGGLLPRFDLLWLLQTLAGEFRARTDPGPAAEIQGQIEELLSSIRSGFGISLYNLRQFPHPAAPYTAQYQDLIRMRLVVGGVQDVRFTDPLASFDVALHRTAVLPIADRLGLSVFSRQRGPITEGMPTIDFLHTILPTSVQADVALTETERLCWRFQQSGWYDDAGRAITPQRGESFPAYNTYLGPSLAAFLEPQPADPVCDVRFLVLPARTEAIRAHLRALVPPECSVQIEPVNDDDYTSVRLLLMRSRARSGGARQELVWLDGNYASISVPVRYRQGGTESRALLLLHDFTDNAFHLQALREMAGSPTSRASFDTEGGDWFAYTQDVAYVARVRTAAIRRSATEALIVPSRLFDVVSVDPAVHDNRLHANVLAPLDGGLVKEMSTFQPMVSFGSIVAPGNPARDIVQRLMFTQIVDYERLEDRSPDPDRVLYVQLHDSETFPLVSQLGLVCLPEDAPLALSLGDEGAAGRRGLVPVVHVSEASVRLRLAGIQILWQRVVP